MPSLGNMCSFGSVGRALRMLQKTHFSRRAKMGRDARSLKSIVARSKKSIHGGTHPSRFLRLLLDWGPVAGQKFVHERNVSTSLHPSSTRRRAVSRAKVCPWGERIRPTSSKDPTQGAGEELALGPPLSWVALASLAGRRRELARAWSSGKLANRGLHTGICMAVA
jgi:hypothetical protein